jgi:peptidoglycan/LPS O-acetylase OafA/YrhL
MWMPAARLESALHSRMLGVLAYTLAGMAVSFAVAYLSWHLFEKQFLKLKWRVPYHRGERELRPESVGAITGPSPAP